MKKLGWGIIGTGLHAERMVSTVLGENSTTEFVAVCDIDMERAQSFAARNGIERVYTSLEKMLADPGLDVLYIVTPNHLHAQQTIQAAEAGKHVLCEKPMALTVPDCESMIEACNKNRVKLGVCFQNRYHPAHIEARRYIQSGQVGVISVAKVQFGRAHITMEGWRGDPKMAGAGALVGQGIHAIDLLRYLMDSEVTEVLAMTNAEPPHRPLEEMACVMIKFDNGAYGTMLCGIVVPRSDNDAVLYGDKAKVTCKGTVGMALEGELLVEGDSINITMNFSADDPGSMNYVRLREDFNRWIAGNSEPDITGQNGLQMVRIINAIIESSQQGRAIQIKN